MMETKLLHAMHSMTEAAETVKKGYEGKNDVKNTARLWSVYLGTEISENDVISLSILSLIGSRCDQGTLPEDLFTSLAVYIARQDAGMDELEEATGKQQETCAKQEDTAAKPKAKTAKKKAAAKARTDIKLTIPELQAKLKAGWSAAKIATYHGVTESYVYLLKKKLKAEQEAALKQGREVLDHMKEGTDEQQGSSQSDV